MVRAWSVALGVRGHPPSSERTLCGPIVQPGVLSGARGCTDSGRGLWGAGGRNPAARDRDPRFPGVERGGVRGGAELSPTIRPGLPHWPLQPRLCLEPVSGAGLGAGGTGGSLPGSRDLTPGSLLSVCLSVRPPSLLVPPYTIVYFPVRGRTSSSKARGPLGLAGAGGGGRGAQAAGRSGLWGWDAGRGTRDAARGTLSWAGNECDRK